MVDSQLYFIAIIPPEPLQSLLWEFKQEVARKFSSKAALKSPPHITLHMPFKMKSKKVEILEKGLAKLLRRHQALRLELNGFGAFPPKVVYIKVLKDPVLKDLQKSIKGFMTKEMGVQNSNYKNKPFKPHMTIAFRDLKKPQFNKAWEYYKDRSFKSACTIDHITLLKHDGNRWNPHVQFNLGNSSLNSISDSSSRDIT